MAVLSGLTIGSLTLSPLFESTHYGYGATTSGASAQITATLNKPDLAEMQIALNGVDKDNKATLTWLKGKNYITINTEYVNTKLLYVIEVNKTGQTISALTITTSEKGEADGLTKITLSGSRIAGTSLVYLITDDALDGDDLVALDDVLDWTPWNGTDEIEAEHGKNIAIAEVLHNGMAKSFGQKTVVSE